MKKRAILGVICLVVGLASCSRTTIVEITATPPPTSEPTPSLAEPTALMILPWGFAVHEYRASREALEEAGYTVAVAYHAMRPIPGNSPNTEVQPDILLPEVRVEDYVAIIYIGYVEHEDALRIAREAAEQGKVLGAICYGPLVLAQTEVLEGKEATVQDGGENCERLVEAGAICTGSAVQRDGLIVTALASAAAEFGATIVEALQDSD
jgi:putative intracellular protease/amidase